MKSLLLLLALFLLTGISYSQWQPDVRLTNDNHESITSTNNARCIAAIGNVVHVVWADGYSGDWRILYKRSLDEGISWEANQLITNDPGTDGAYEPSISVSGSFIYVAWTDIRFRPNWEIYFKRSTNGGVNWGSAERLTTTTTLSRNPSIASSDSVVHVVWSENGLALYKRSTDWGITWGFGTQLSNGTLTSGYPSISVSGSTLHAVWSENNDIYYKRSTDAGVSWETDQRLTNEAANSWSPSVSVSGEFICVVWHDLRDGNYEIYSKQSANGGTTWGTDTRLTIGSEASYNPSVFASGSIIHVAWYDVYFNYRILYKKSLNGGASWETDIILTNFNGASINPFVSVAGPVVHVIYYDTRDFVTEIYYKRNPTGNIVYILNLTSIIEGFYNPASNLMISDTATVYLRNDFSPYAILDSSKSVLNSSGTGNFYFSGVTNGTNYFIVVRHRNSIETWSRAGNSFMNETLTYNFSDTANKAFGNNQKQVDTSPIRFAVYSGDVNQDGLVDGSDASLIDNDAFNFVTGYAISDVNGDGTVDGSDAVISDNNAFNFVGAIIP